MKHIKMISLALAVMLIFSACTSGEVTENPNQKENYDIINPLTGQALDKDISGRRPFVFVLNNLRAALPQCAVSDADIIYEAPVEGGITRMLAVYQDITGIGNVGAIRSARPYLVEIAMSYDPIFIHAGGSDDAYKLISDLGVDNFDGVNGRRGTAIFYRDENRLQTAGYEHSLFTSDALISEHLYKIDGLRFDHNTDFKYNQKFETEIEPRGDAASEITVAITSSKDTVFTYDDEQNRYMIAEYGAPYIDGNTNSTVSAQNVLILCTDVSRISGDSAGRLSVRTTGNGTGYYAVGGKMVKINWSRDSANDMFTYTYEDGSAVALCRGNTYVCLVDGADRVTVAH